jgi:hypothetical protein
MGFEAFGSATIGGSESGNFHFASFQKIWEKERKE